MDLALAMLVLWALLFLPIGLAMHGLVLGAAARVRALPLAPVTGIAIALLVLSLLARLGVDAGEGWVAWGFVAASVASALVVWRAELPWRSRELIGSSLLLLLAVLLVQLPVVGERNDGPLGYGTAANPVEEVAAVDAASGGPTARTEIAKQAAASAEERPVAFEQFAALTVAIGRMDDTARADASWTAYSLHAPLTGMLAALVALPLFGFARARGVRSIGLVFLVPVGVLAPYTFLGLANGTGAAVATVPMLAAAVFSLLVTRRDRGWWSLAVLFGGAIAVTAGALALLPLLTIGVTWMLLRSTTYEHLAQKDVPLGRIRALSPGLIAAALAVVGVVTTLRDGELLAWPALHENLLATVRSWPFAWLDTDLATSGPSGQLETAIWLAGPALLVIAAIHGVVRNERRELAVLIGAVLAAGVALLAAVGERSAGIRLFEYTILVVSPLLAALAVRGVSLARENAESSATRGSVARIAGWGPVLLAVGFVVLSLASTSVTGTRMVHAPELVGASIKEGEAIVAGGDPWLAFVVDGPRVDGGYADADTLTTRDRETGGLPLTSWDTLVLSSSPIGSDPTSRFAENSDLDSYQARLFYDRVKHPDAGADSTVSDELLAQRQYVPVAERDAATESGATDGEQAQDAADSISAEPAPLSPPLRHDPVEGANTQVAAGAPGGLLVPPTDIAGCTPSSDGDTGGDSAINPSAACTPQEPTEGATCTSADIAAVRSPLDKPGAEKRQANGTATAPATAQVLGVPSDPTATIRPPLLGVQCFDVQVDPAARVLQVHLRNVGVVLAPELARVTGPRSSWSTTRPAGSGGLTGGVRRATDAQDATISYGDDRLTGSFDVGVEGSFGAGVDLQSSASAFSVNPDGNLEESSQTEAVATLRGSADGFGSIVRDVPLQGNVVLENASGTDVEFGRVFVRPRDIPASCDVAVGLRTGEQRELRLESIGSTQKTVQRPGLTVAVVESSGTGADRTARIAVGSYLAFGGLPRHVLIDWTEQFRSPLEIEGCDGEKRTEAGFSPPGAAPTVAATSDDLAAFAGAAPDDAVDVEPGTVLRNRVSVTVD